MNSSTHLIVLSAPSGAGKTTLSLRLLKDFPELQLSISSTTRAPRGAEQHGKEYFFLKKEEFQNMIQRDRFAEWAEVHGNFYGTSKDAVEAAFAQGKSLLLDIDVQGAASIRKAYPKESYLIFVAPPSLEELESRLRSRGTDKEETIQRRLTNARDEMARMKEFDRVITNDQLDRAYSELKDLVRRRLES